MLLNEFTEIAVRKRVARPQEPFRSDVRDPWHHQELRLLVECGSTLIDHFEVDHVRDRHRLLAAPTLTTRLELLDAALDDVEAMLRFRLA